VLTTTATASDPDVVARLGEAAVARGVKDLVPAALDGDSALDAALRGTSPSRSAVWPACWTGSPPRARSLVFAHDDRLPEAVRRLRLRQREGDVIERPHLVVDRRLALVSVGARSYEARTEEPGMSVSDRAAGALLGLVVGDALGCRTSSGRRRWGSRA
jgi:hypothetical protein